jgi:predicted AlkP superfamily phosphohydrolase/phosphomutase
MVKRVLVIGLDSAPWGLISRWGREGKLPTIGGLIAEGAAGILRSTFPPLSPAAWSSFATGMQPGKHGVYDHMYRQAGTYEYTPTNARVRGGKTLWRIVSEQGGTVGVINVPETYPPEPVNGFLIAGMDTPGDDADFCYPPELFQELKEAIGGYKVFSPISREDLEQTRKGLHETARMRIQAGRYLWQRYQPQLMILVLMETDTIQHRFWKFMDPHHPQHDPAQTKRYGDAIFELYRDIDRQLVDFLAQVDEDTTVILMSDHGAGPLHRQIHTNNWLVQQGWLQFKGSLPSQLRQALFRLGITPENVLPVAAAMHMGFTDRVARMGLSGQVESKGLMRLFLSLRDVDWERTRAYALGSHIGGIYLNVKGREPQGIVEPGKEYETLRQDIAQKLNEWVDEATGERLVSQVRMREKVYSGPYLERAPDILFDCYDGRYLPIVARGFPKNTITAPPQLDSGSHRRDGLVVLKGQPFRQGVSLPAYRIEDLAPTILHLLGYGVPSDVDGQVMIEAYTQEYLSAHPIRQAEGSWIPAGDASEYTVTEEAAVAERLKDLGYL